MTKDDYYSILYHRKHNTTKRKTELTIRTNSESDHLVKSMSLSIYASWLLKAVEIICSWIQPGQAI